VLRSLKKHRLTTSAALLFGVLLFGLLLWAIFGPGQGALKFASDLVERFIYGVVPMSLVAGIDRFLSIFGLKEGLVRLIDILAHLVALLALFALAGYVASFPVYEIVRKISMGLDRLNYKKIAGTAYSVKWHDTEETNLGESS
jgi:hypothetical protein